MPENYQDAVLAAYKQKKKEEGSGLPLNLLKPTTVKLKRECLKRYDKSDEAKNVFSDFFDVDRLDTEFHEYILGKDPDDFKALLNHLQEKTTKTDEKNTELLAWLIDFKPRPSIAYYTNPPGGTLSPPPPPPPPPIPPKNNHIAFKITTSIITILIISIVYWFWRNNADKTIRQPLATEHCMYWTGQHYEPINCNDNEHNKVKLPLNLQQLNHQQRITMPDTLTSYALGKVWYGKVNGSIDKTPQFYTDSGTNPLDTTKRLLPLTPYMLYKYVSYERYLLSMLVWIVSLFVLFSLLVTLAYKTRPRHKKEKN